MTTKITPGSKKCTNRYTERVNGVLGVDNSSTAVVSWSDSFTGGSEPHWRSRLADGYDATHAAAGERYRFEPGYGSFLFHGNHSSLHVEVNAEFSGAIFGAEGAFINPSAQLEIDADSIARVKFQQKVRQAITQLQGGVVLGELRETIHLLRNPAFALRKGISQYVRTAKKRISRAKTSRARRNVLQDTWLEYSFGWQPLVNDIKDAAKAVEATPDRFRKPIQSFGESITDVTPYEVRKATGFYDFTGKFISTKKVSVIYKGAVDFRKFHSNELSARLGFTVSNIVPTLWELIPWSFFIDYFSNIGNVIDAASLGTTGLSWGKKSVQRYGGVKFISVKSNVSPSPAYPDASTSVYCDGYVSERVQFTRTPVNFIDVSVGDLQFRCPGVDNPWRWLNIGALFARKG